MCALDPSTRNPPSATRRCAVAPPASTRATAYTCFPALLQEPAIHNHRRPACQRSNFARRQTRRARVAPLGHTTSWLSRQHVSPPPAPTPVSYCALAPQPHQAGRYARVGSLFTTTCIHRKFSVGCLDEAACLALRLPRIVVIIVTKTLPRFCCRPELYC